MRELMEKGRKTWLTDGEKVKVDENL